jgi:(1->4)-alpha-D-glucan 1-alpha-D-glucosylmutase
LIKLTGPGIPDISQGAEQLDFSLVDPDNRRMPDYAKFAQDLRAPLSARDDVGLIRGIAKQQLIAKGLALRNAEPTLFAEGEYQPISISGARADHAVAFLRRHHGKLFVAIAPRLVFGLGDREWPCGDYWGDSAAHLPDAGRWTLRNLIDDQVFKTATPLTLAKVLQNSPVALLISQ